MLKKICVNIEEIIAGIALCIMSVATVFNVFCRLVLSKSYPWAEEISYFCFAFSYSSLSQCSVQTVSAQFH